MVYGFWFFLFFIGWFFFWVIVYWKGVGFVFLGLPAASGLVFLAVLGGAFVVAFLFGWLIGLPPGSQFIALWVLLALCLIAVPSVFYLVWKRRKWEVKLMAGEIQTKIEGAKRRLDEDPADWGAWLVLAKTYEKQGNLEESIEAYSRALSLMGESPIRSKTEGQVRFLSGVLERKRNERTALCDQCNSRNLPGDRLCRNCQASLYRTFFHWVFANLDSRVKYTLAAIVVLFSLFFFRLNPVFVVLLILLWCFDIVYFSLPVEFKN